MSNPFGADHVTVFSYRLSETFRRVFQDDALGHLLVARYFDSLLGSRFNPFLLGVHPGMEVVDSATKRVIGEADVLLLTHMGHLVPIEVKRSAGGVTDGELAKLDILSEALGSPWSGVAVSNYLGASDVALANLQVRATHDRSYIRTVLTYEQVLDPFPAYSLGTDPFELSEIEAGELEKREAHFVKQFSSGEIDRRFDWLERRMLGREASDS